MARKPSFAIIGAGNGGLTMAGDLVLHGFEVSGLHDRLPEAIAPIQKRGGIELVGEVLSGFAPIPNATTDLPQAVRGAGVIAVVVPAFAHESVAASDSTARIRWRTCRRCSSTSGLSSVSTRASTSTRTSG